MRRRSSCAHRTIRLATCCERECFAVGLPSGGKTGRLPTKHSRTFSSDSPLVWPSDAHSPPTPPPLCSDAYRRQLLLDPTVLFAGYKVPHPLENVITIKIQTDERSNPADALKRACQLLITQTLAVKKQFQDQARNIEMGMGPEAAPQAAGGYDPYGDGFGSAAPGGGAAQGGDVYDF